MFIRFQYTSNWLTYQGNLLRVICISSKRTSFEDLATVTRIDRLNDTVHNMKTGYTRKCILFDSNHLM